ncbi:MAG TPA: MlaD family protein, partial [Candidatus Hypogeohydataceae bacterium YC40]
SVGHVKKVVFPEDPSSKLIEVEMEINKRFRKRIRMDSVCSIKVLSYVTGEPYIEITVGSADKPIVEEGAYLNSKEALDYFTAFEGSLDAFSSLTRSITKLEETRLIETLAGATSALRASIESVQKGEGILHSLVYDPKGKEMFDNLFATTESLKGITREMREGDNAFHTILYDKEFRDGVKALALMSKKINQSMETEQGLLPSLLFDPEKKALLNNLAEISANLKVVTEKTARGEGTLGAIINDPGLYEDLKSLMGGVQRSFLLRRMIQKSIKKGREAE